MVGPVGKRRALARVSLDPAGKFMDLSPSFACLWDSILSIARQYLAYPSINLLITY